MYKAVDCRTGEELIILAPEWRTRLATLRDWCHQGLLICQACRQPLRVKAGRFRRRHFAHQHLKACSLETESPALLSARAVLYEWLVKRFPEGVTLEKALETGGLPRPVDGWVETGGLPLAYWIIDAGLKLETRDKIQAALADLPIRVHWVLTANLLREEPRQPGSLHLTPTERAFLRHSELDGPVEGDFFTANAQSLHYLDPEAETLTSYRGLKVIHLPQWYQGEKHRSTLGDVLPSPSSGEFIHPGEAERLASYRVAKGRKDKIREKAEERLAAWSDRLRVEPGGLQISPITGAPGENYPALVEGVCIFCGQITTDWWSLLPAASEGFRRCKCRECLKQGLF